MPKTWQLQEAKNRFSEVVEQAVRSGPQQVTKRGKAAVVVLSAKEFDTLRRGNDSLVEFLRRSPLKRLDLGRARDLPREVDL